MAAVVSTRREESGSFLSHLKELLFLWYHYELENETSTIPTPQKNELISPDYLVWLRSQARKVTIVADVRRYMQDIVIFLRTHRLVRRGVSTKACRDFDLLVRCLCVLHNYEFATPTLVSIAARKIFPLKIEMCDPYDEPTLQYGGDVQLIAKWMKQWDQELIIESVLEQVDPPL
ncbi:hypothetical protein TRVA0_036S01288 [Trichomonascus vanleenenianus]|uniref:Mtc2p n=1 Tax=Trichomonascus vanleenenianus TaxID=2268995 RepID=UPI003ECA582D